MLWARTLELRRCSSVSSSYSLSSTVSTIGAFAAKRGDRLGGATLEEAGGLGDIDGGKITTFGRSSNIGSSSGSRGKSKTGVGIGKFLGEEIMNTNM